MQNKMSAGKKVRIIVAAVAILIGVAMAVYSYMILPAEVSTQFENFMNTGAPTSPKWLAVLLPLGITAVYALKSISKPKAIFICLLGYVMNVLFWLCN